MKQHGEPDEAPEKRYSPAMCADCEKKAIKGNPDMDLVSTSYAERQNLNMRMQNRRYTRLTNAFSKKAEMLGYSVAITFMYHNFIRFTIHRRRLQPSQPGLSIDRGKSEI